ncbi:MAG: response regulator [Bacteroidia bacterium]
MNYAKKVLFVDDDADDQYLFKDALSELQNVPECIIANNGLDALEKIAWPPPPDIIFLDINMPVMDGFECLSILKRQDRYKDIPVIIYSTSSQPNDVERSKKLGASLFLTKPNNFTFLIEALNKILSFDFKKDDFAF